ncbi:hypothetical protein CERZMDRAFT_91935 [Cercospora zeae-maydis SCOH1-5]|uniref:Uncharacterized protein n=1 Tax=Cercospora zeae-maydis SCOH1-5 TaxID=717836 RepID=A0A6A6EY45_9PEZI|nr:hypothetical protein CERZMDRAFT_91935 [Cercospora zeae-maydis SCOH1-5]
MAKGNKKQAGRKYRNPKFPHPLPSPCKARQCSSACNVLNKSDSEFQPFQFCLEDVVVGSYTRLYASESREKTKKFCCSSRKMIVIVIHAAQQPRKKGIKRGIVTVVVVVVVVVQSRGERVEGCRRVCIVDIDDYRRRLMCKFRVKVEKESRRCASRGASFDGQAESVPRWSRPGVPVCRPGDSHVVHESSCARCLEFRGPASLVGTLHVGYPSPLTDSSRATEDVYLEGVGGNGRLGGGYGGGPNVEAGILDVVGGWLWWWR